ncbi:MAG: rod-binding protein [Pseudomonadota bacterium]
MIDPTALTSAQNLQSGVQTPQSSSAQAAQEFEGMFLSVMIGQMFSGLSTEAPFGGGYGEEAFRGLLIEEYGKAIADRGGLGLAEPVQRELLALQEV